jgi:predicted DNA binding CopG/RHH family protein
MTNDPRESLLKRDWGDSWDTLERAPDLIARRQTGQITLRLPASVVARLKRVARVRGLPYHSLVRSWLIEGLRATSGPVVDEPDPGPQTTQLNLKLEMSTLDILKARGHDLGKPYHRLAREIVESAIEAAEQNLALPAPRVDRPPIKELMVLLLHAPNKDGNSTVRGITRLQKLLFIIEQKLASQSSFYAFNYGPFNEEVNDSARALEVAGFIRSTEAAASGPPSFEHMLATVVQRAGRGDDVEVEFTLSDRGHEAAEALRESDPKYERLFELIASVREEWDTPQLGDLVDRVYATWPEYAEKSVIADKVVRRNKRKDGR